MKWAVSQKLKTTAGSVYITAMIFYYSDVVISDTCVIGARKTTVKTPLKEGLRFTGGKSILLIKYKRGEKT